LGLYACRNDKPIPSGKLIKHVVYEIRDSVRTKSDFKDTSYLAAIFESYQLTDIHTLDSTIHVQLKYADTANFLKRDFYDGLTKAYFPCEVALRICNAQYFLKQYDSTLSLLILDATRPLHVQQMMWDSLQMPPDKKFNYLSPPYNLSLHNYGCAVDLTILNLSTGKTLDMGSEFDHFGKLSEPVYEWQFLKTGELTREAFENRKLLRKVMRSARLEPITSEWWHFNYCSKEYASTRFTLIK
jgi:D-alanyl-D-alanine dipeptidase